jgi:hypothetical protein
MSTLYPQTLNTAGATYPEYLLIVQRPTTRLLFLRRMSRSEITEVCVCVCVCVFLTFSSKLYRLSMFCRYV